RWRLILRSVRTISMPCYVQWACQVKTARNRARGIREGWTYRARGKRRPGIGTPKAGLEQTFKRDASFATAGGEQIPAPGNPAGRMRLRLACFLPACPAANPE